MPEALTGSPIGLIRTISALRARVDAWKQEHQKVVLVPTMGALHAGHLSLIKLARMQGDRVIASIFVNPSQFAPHEDFDAYPRRAEDDLRALADAGCDLAYLPEASTMYPPGYQTRITVDTLAADLCGVSRPHFFGGVATVVCKLLNQARPDYAIFGEKDFQQLLIIRRMVADLDMGVSILGAPIVRDTDGLALSSRNAYLTPDERRIAPALHRAILAAARAIEAGAAIDDAIGTARASLTDAGFDRIDYLDVRDSQTLESVVTPVSGQPLRILAAAVLGQTRLIDNVPATAQ